MFVGGFFSFRRVLLITSNRVFFDALGGFYFSSFSGAFFCHAARHNRGENNLAGDKECVTIARTFSSDCDGYMAACLLSGRKFVPCFFAKCITF